MRMERRRSSLTPCWPRLEAGDTRLEVEEPIFQLEQVTLTTVQCCTVLYCTVLYCTVSRSPSPGTPRPGTRRPRTPAVSPSTTGSAGGPDRSAPDQNAYLPRNDTDTFTVQGAEDTPHDSISPLPLSADDKRKYKKGNKHKGDYCFVDLGLEPAPAPAPGPDKRRSSSFSCSQHKPWKTLTFNKK